MKALQALLFSALALGLSNANATATCSARNSSNHSSQTAQASAKQAAATVYAENVQPKAPVKTTTSNANR